MDNIWSRRYVTGEEVEQYWVRASWMHWMHEETTIKSKYTTSFAIANKLLE
jgi:hypothetical protein